MTSVGLGHRERAAETRPVAAQGAPLVRAVAGIRNGARTGWAERESRAVRSHCLRRAQLLRVVAQVVVDKALDEVIAVVVAGLAA